MYLLNNTPTVSHAQRYYNNIML